MSDIGSTTLIADFSNTESEYLPASPFIVEGPTILIGFGICEDDEICLRIASTSKCDGNATALVKVCGCTMCLTNDNNVLVIPFPGRFMLHGGATTNAKIYRQDWSTAWDINALIPCCEGECP